MIIGGAASGKSHFAETLVTNESKQPVYLATAQAFDDEMVAKIAEHRADRADQGWQTIEEPKDVAKVLMDLPPGVVLLDCATMWLSNRLMETDDLREEITAFCEAAKECSNKVVVVTNEVGLGIVPENAMARKFRNLQGNLNFTLASKADLVVQVVAGLPNVLKGQLP